MITPDRVMLMSQETPAPASARRPQAERRAEMRARIIRAAIACLHRLGYGGATINEVIQEAGVSRGALSHHFASKTELMLAVVREVFERDVAHYNRSLASLAPKAWLRAAPATLWQAINTPSAIAVIEIMLASRSDLELAQRLRTIQGRINEQSFDWMKERYRAAGLEPRPDHEALHRLCVAAARGLALEAVYMGGAAEFEKSIAVLAQALQALHGDLGED